MARLGTSPEFPRLVLPIYWLANLVCYGFGEEVGWRGFLLPRLQAKRQALTASLIVAAIWAGWHLVGAGGGIGWAISIVTGFVITAWLFNASGGSVMGGALTVTGFVLPRLAGRANLSGRARVTEP
ncbi:hypothetical protein BH11MYX1_BH11MYX1_47990 [soil metagenome]